VNEHRNEAMDVDALISRVVDGEATGAQWRLFCEMTESDPTLWRQLAEAQQQHAELSAEVGEAVQVAAHVEAPIVESMAFRFQERVRTAVVVGGWSGWLAAAAALFIAWGLGLPGAASNALPLHDGRAGGMVQAGIGGGWTDALQAYLERGQASGQVVGQLPDKILLEARPLHAGTAAGGYEVIYLRQIMERVVVPELYGVGSDDAGQPAPVRIHLPRAKDPWSM
jgi:hypothetical protein